MRKRRVQYGGCILPSRLATPKEGIHFSGSLQSEAQGRAESGWAESEELPLLVPPPHLPTGPAGEALWTWGHNGSLTIPWLPVVQTGGNFLTMTATFSVCAAVSYPGLSLNLSTALAGGRGLQTGHHPVTRGHTKAQEWERDILHRSRVLPLCQDRVSDSQPGHLQWDPLGSW